MEMDCVWLIKAHLKNPKKFFKGVMFLFRLITSPIRTLPDFIIIGFPKCGTTSLYEYLVQHPSILPAFQKEVFFFIWHVQKGMLWYRAYFPTVLSKFIQKLRKRKFITGEATPTYLLYSETPQQIHDMNPNTKVIVLLRNPAEKAVSTFNHLVRKRRAENIDDVIKADITSKNLGTMTPLHHIVSNGIYMKFIPNLFKVFPKEQVLILKSEDLFEDPKTEVNKCFRFLGLEEFELPKYKNFNPGNYKKADSKTQKFLDDFYKPHNKKLYDYLGRDFGWNKK